MKQSAVVLRLGRMMQACGAGSYRIKGSMARLAAAVGLDRHEALVTLTEITTSSYAGEYFRTEVSEQRQVGMNAHRLDEIRRLVAELQPGTRVETVEAELDRIEALPLLYGRWFNAGAAGAACAGFSYLNGGTWVEGIAVFVAAFFGQFLRRAMLARRYNHFGTWAVCGFVSATLYVVIILGLQTTDVIDSSHRAGVVSAILFLMPGFPMVTAMLDLFRHDFSSALSRAAYVVTVMTAAGVAVWAVISLFDWEVLKAVDHTPHNLVVANALRVAASFVGAYGIAMLFNSPPKVALTAGVIGGLANPGRIIAIELGMAWQAGVGIAAFTIGVLATLLAGRTSHSRVSLSVPAIVIMIPGAPFYVALTALNGADFTGALASLAEIVFVIMSIGIGLAFARTLMDPGWRHDTPTSTLPNLRVEQPHRRVL